MHHIIDRVRVSLVLHNLPSGSTFHAEWVPPNEKYLDDDALGNNEYDADDEYEVDAAATNRWEIIVNYMFHLS